jgi:hypothetical protein
MICSADAVTADGRNPMHCTPNTSCAHDAAIDVLAQQAADVRSLPSKPVVSLRKLDLTVLSAGAFGDLEPETRISGLAKQSRTR